MPIDKVQAMKENRGSGTAASLILNLYIRWKVMTVFLLYLMSHESGLVMELLIR